MALPRLIIYFSAFAFGIIGLAAGINSFVKSESQKNFVKTHTPQVITVDIDTSDIVAVGAVLTTGCAGLAIAAFFTFFADIFQRHLPHKIDGYTLGFWTLWIFVVDIANTIISRDRSAHVTATFGRGGLPVPQTAVTQTERELGVSPEYWDQSSVRFFAIVTWFTFLFGAMATAVSFMRNPSTKKVEKA